MVWINKNLSCTSIKFGKNSKKVVEETNILILLDKATCLRQREL
jgi:hypothetical protein